MARGRGVPRAAHRLHARSAEFGRRKSVDGAGRLRLGDVAEPDSLNPLLSTMDLSYDFSSLTFSYFVVADAHGEADRRSRDRVPSVANGGISRDGRTLRLPPPPRRALARRRAARLARRRVHLARDQSPRNNVCTARAIRRSTGSTTPDDRDARRSPAAPLPAVRHPVLHHAARGREARVCPRTCSRRSARSTTSRTTRCRSARARSGSRRGIAARGSCWSRNEHYFRGRSAPQADRTARRARR